MYTRYVVCIFRGHACVCVCLTIRAQVNFAQLLSRVGIQVFNMWRLALASCASITHAALLEGVFEDLSVQFNDMPSSVVEAAIANSLSKSLDFAGIPSSDVTCVRDYSAACPEEWADQGDGETCSAPMYYQGPCSKSLSFASLTPAEKRATAATCGYQFPCVDTCTIDFSTLCPDGWTEDSSKHCIAPLEYTGACVGRKDFQGMSTHKKSQWSSVCNVRWPCRGQRGDATGLGDVHSCDADFSATCPDRWTTVGVQCVGPIDYQGPCATMVDLSGLTVVQKDAYAQACHTPWPCGSDSLLGSGTSFLQYALQDNTASDSQRFIVDSKLRASQLTIAKKEIAKLIPRVKAGGRMASKALARLVSLTSDPDAKSVMISAGAVAAAETLMKRPDTSDRNVALAGSLLTMLSGMPVAVEVSDVAGANGHVDIILPRPSRVYQPDEVALQSSFA